MAGEAFMSVERLRQPVCGATSPDHAALPAAGQQHYQRDPRTQPNGSLNRHFHQILSFPVFLLVAVPRLAGGTARAAALQEEHHQPTRGNPDHGLNNRIVHVCSLLKLSRFASSSGRDI
jgi:hypothetical protein